MTTLKVISDVVCPWCYIGKHRLDQALALLPEHNIEVQWLPFELNPNLPIDGMPREDYCVRKFGSLENAQRIYGNVAAHANADGLAINLEKIAITPNTKRAHRLIWYASQQQLGDAVVDNLFGAYFVNGEDISNIECLAKLGAAAGLEEAQVNSFLHSDRGTQETRVLTEASYDSGVQGVPAFMWGDLWLFAGAQSPETIALVLEKQLEK